MTLPTSIQDREQQKFVDVASGKTAVRVYTEGLLPTQYDRVDVTYPTTVSEVFTFSLQGSDVGIITLTYTDTTKNDLLSAVRS